MRSIERISTEYCRSYMQNRSQVSRMQKTGQDLITRELRDEICRGTCRSIHYAQAKSRALARLLQRIGTAYCLNYATYFTRMSAYT